MFKVKKAIKIINNKIYENYFICNPSIPVFHLCKFLDLKGKNSENTQKTYASILVQWLNFLYSRKNKQYYEVDLEDLKKYIYSQIFFNKENNYVLKPDLTYITLKMKNKVIYEFYKFLLGEVNSKTSILSILSQGKELNYHFTLKLKEFRETGINSIDFYMTKYKSSRKEKYIMEYTEKQIFSINSNLNYLRDKLIFQLTLYGMRIDEVLSIKIKDVNNIENTIKPSRSKTDKNRIIVVSKETIKYINNYVHTERMNSIIYAGVDSEYLFINLNRGKNCAKPVTYQTFYTALKRAGINAGFDKNQIRTHSGRSTRTMELLKNDNISDEIIRYIMGWKSPLSINPYIEEKSKSLAIKGAQFIAKENSKNNNENKSNC